MPSVTIGTPDAYLRLTAPPWPGEQLPRGFVEAALHTEEVTATRVLDLRRDGANLVQFFDNVANRLDGPMVWGMRTELELAFQRVQGPVPEPEYLVLSITLRNRGWHQRAWTLETALATTPNQLHQATHNLKTLLD